MRKLPKKSNYTRPRGQITSATFGKKLAEHHREMLRKMFPKRGG